MTALRLTYAGGYSCRQVEDIDLLVGEIRPAPWITGREIIGSC